MRFPRISIRGFIEGILPPKRGEGSTYFREFLFAALLKAEGVRSLAALLREFPRISIRGFIEGARGASERRLGPSHFREFLFAALLKAHGLDGVTERLGDFREFLFAALLKDFYPSTYPLNFKTISANFYSRLY